ncbi:MAG TPA: ParB N-terminal domain-containing protein [Urbifossiella sp.]|nr:ParB N-terminal domain-containing protein [Urbifossiella sp.]
MEVELWLVGRLKPYPQNPRHNDAGVDAVAASIKAWGFRQPIVVDKADVLIVGHTRYKAALKLGLAEVPVHVARGLTPEQARAYRIADNQTATLSAWDDGLLAQELAALQAADFDLALTVFAARALLWRRLGRGRPNSSSGRCTAPRRWPPPSSRSWRPGGGRTRHVCGAWRTRTVWCRSGTGAERYSTRCWHG